MYIQHWVHNFIYSIFSDLFAMVIIATSSLLSSQDVKSQLWKQARILFQRGKQGRILKSLVVGRWAACDQAMGRLTIAPS